MKFLPGMGIAGAASALLLCGCAGAPPSEADRDRQAYRETAERLEPGGSFFCVSNPAYVLQGVRALRADAERSVSASMLPAERKREIQIGISAAALVFRLSGAGEIRAQGFSSVLCQMEAGNPLFRNRSFLLLPEHPRGALWKMAGEVNRPLLKEIATLPKCTLLAADFNMNPAALTDAVRTVFPEIVENGLLKSMLGMTPGELAKHLSGEWGIAFLAEPGTTYNPDEPLVVLTLPDPGGKLWTRLRNVCKAMPICNVSGESVEFKLKGSAHSPYVTGGGDLLIVCSSKRVWELFSSSDGTLGDDPLFRRMAAELPSDGIGIFYAAGECGYRLDLGGVTLNPELFSPLPELSVVRREKNGFLELSCGGSDYNKRFFNAFVLAPLTIGVELYNRFGQTALSEHLSGGNVSRRPAPVPEPEAKVRFDDSGCRRRMETVAATVKTFREKNNGAFPEKLPPETRCPSAPADFKEAHYFLFTGDFKGEESGRIPLVLENPRLHGSSFGVLYRDGTVEVISLEHADSVKRAVSYLHSRNNYGEKNFLELIRQAAEMDKR